MRSIFVCAAVVCAALLIDWQAASADVFNMPAGQASLITLPVGNPGNAADPANSSSVPGIGSVSYSYSIAEYDVTVGQYTAFLNAVAKTDTYSLYNPNLATDGNVAGIAQNGTSGSYTYSVIGSPNHPVGYISWYDAARFANWLSNGQPKAPEGTGTTETGSYTLGGLNPTNVARNANATWFIPTENEWYKAAYYNPSNKTYYEFPASSNILVSAPPGNQPGTANIQTQYGGFAVTGSTDYSLTQNYLTDVGAYTASVSPYGEYDMGGDMEEWDEAIFASSNRGLRGGDYGNDGTYAAAYYRPYFDPTIGDASFGFRMASVLKPGDFNRDGHVDAKDIAVMEQALANLDGYEQTHGDMSDSQVTLIGDVNGDGKFNNADLQALLNLLKSGGGSTNPVPEPTTLVMLAIGAACLVKVRRGFAV